MVATDSHEPGAHLIGAYGQFWRRDEVNWLAPRWQLLGHRGHRRPGLRFCDFRRAAGIYILYDNHGATYVGLARGNDGIGTRLHAHVHDRSKAWDRFSWFAFDDVVDDPMPGWSRLALRDTIEKTTATDVVREFEALLIQVLGTGRPRGQQINMNFLNAQHWRQMTYQAGINGGLVNRVDRAGFTDTAWWGDALT